MTQKGRLSGLDALRGLAAIAVVLHHYTVGFSEVTGLPFTPSFTVPDGHYGVELFFIISGFVIIMTLDRSPHPYDFVASRISRLIPAFWTCMFLTAAASVLLGMRWMPKLGLRSIVANMTMAPRLFGLPAIDPSYWTLAYELVFYVLAALAYYAGGRRRIAIFWSGWLALSVCSHLIGIERIPDTIKLLLALQWAPFFVIGVMLYRIRLEGWMAFEFLVLAAALTMCLFGPNWSFRAIHSGIFLALVATFTGLVWLGTMPDSPLARLLPLVFLGDISYSLYLIHQVIGFAFIERATRFEIGADWAVLLATCLAVLAAVGIGKLAEKPGQRMLRAAFARHRSKFVS
jgi:peptidoglycan/LPS O-acetylase OafA/YrhL